MSDPASTSTCYRHPDVEAFVRCQRCSRPICPNCQHEAAVGVQCPECVRAAAPAATRSVFGAPVRAGRPLVTWTIIVVSAVVFVLQLVTEAFGGQNVTDLLAFSDPLVYYQPWRWLSYSLVHSPYLPFGLLHIGFNMYAVYLIGPALENAFGRLRFLALWLLSVFGGSVAYALMVPVGGGMVGASGGVFGLFAAWFVVARRMRLNTSAIMGILVLNLILGFVVSGIAWQGHLGGLVAGAAAAAFLAHAPPAGRTAVQAAGLAGMTVLLVALAWLSGTLSGLG